jgi:hypothetical protein
MYHTEACRREEKTTNNNAKKDIAFGVVALGVGAALGAVLGNDSTRKSLVENAKNWFNNHRQNQQ